MSDSQSADFLAVGLTLSENAQAIAFSRVAGGRPYSFWLGRRRWNSALSGCAVGVLMLLAAGFLSRELYATPLLRTEIGSVAALLGVGGLASVVWGLNALLGRLVLDRRGLRYSAAVSRFTIDWQDLAAWEVRSGARLAGGPGLRFWLRQALAPVTVPSEWLSNEDCGAIHALLRATAPDLEGLKSATKAPVAAMASGLA